MNLLARPTPAFAVAAFLFSFSSTTFAQTDDPPPFLTQPPCQCACPLGRRLRPEPMVLGQNTTDVAVGFTMSFGRTFDVADGSSDRLAALDATVVHRFLRHGTGRAAVEPAGIRRTGDGRRALLLRASVLVGYHGPIVRALVGLAGWSAQADDEYGELGFDLGVQALGRIELGRPFAANIVVQGGSGTSNVLDPYVGGRQRVPGYSGEMSIQLPFPTSRRDFAAIRLVTRWFGGAGATYGEAGFDVAAAKHVGAARPVIVVGYRWTASWVAPESSRHGFHLRTEWYGLGGGRSAAGAAAALDTTRRRFASR